jgi:hypothetical protein
MKYTIAVSVLLMLSPSLAAQVADAPMRVGVVLDPFPGVDLVAAEATVRILSGGSEFAVTRLGLSDLESPSRVNAGKFDVLVLTHTHHLTTEASNNFRSFIKAGGDLVLLGPDGFLPGPHQGKTLLLPAFSAYEPYVLRGIRTIAPFAGQAVISGVAPCSGEFEGLSAVGFVRTSAQFTPLLTALDEYGRERGWAAGLMVDFSEYTGSNWLLFGVRTPGFYSSRTFAETLRKALRKMAGPGLTEAARREQEKRLQTRIRLKSPPPAGRIRLSPDGKHLVYPDGKRFFLIGANYHRPLHTGEWYDGKSFDDAAFEDDFRKARDAGINCIRLGPSQRFYDDPEIVKECARKYGIYLLIILNWGTRQDFVENAERVARLYAGEPMVLGYDIQNEPPAESVAGLQFEGEPSPVMKLRPYESFLPLLDQTVLERAVREAPASRGRSIAPEARRDMAAFSQAWARATDPIARRSGSTYPGMGAEFLIKEPWKGLGEAVNQTFDIWIRKHIEAIRRHDKDALVTVGYNNVLQGLPANSQLDFTSQHVYDWPLSYEQVMSNLTAMDRMAALWPGKPITLGEFGYSNGVPMPDGRLLDFHSSSVGEMAHYLWALAKGHDGAMKWVVTDWHWDAIAKAADRGRTIQVYEAYFGMYYYDGNPNGMGRPKPISHATRFLRDYVEEYGAGGSIEVIRGGTAMGAAYRFHAPHAMFVGDTQFESQGIRFQSKTPANVMVTWDEKGLRLMATADVTVSLRAEHLSPAFKGKQLVAEGLRGRAERRTGWLELPLLEGEVIRLAIAR